ncbi:MAG: hypothetical protein LBK18_00345 [Prevotellaceae bacterium]|nr:hypothetical protein [Prevotellaceae bacterium]
MFRRLRRPDSLEKQPAPYDDVVNVSDLAAGVHFLELVTGNDHEMIME